MKLGIFSALITVSAMLLIYVVVRALKNKHHAHSNNNSRSNYRCAAGFCEIMISPRLDGKTKFCKFHNMVQKHYLILVENNDPMQQQAQMYMSSNGNYFTDSAAYERARKELERAVNKYKK